MSIFLTDSINPVKELFECEVYTCLDECDKEVAEYAKMNGAMGILGQDSDYTIYNTSPYYFSSNHLNLETLDTLVYDRAALCKVLHLSIEQLPVLSCLIGTYFIESQTRHSLFPELTFIPFYNSIPRGLC